MFWERKTTTTPLAAPAPQYGPPAMPVVQTAPIGSLEAASTTMLQHTRLMWQLHRWQLRRWQLRRWQLRPCRW